MNLMCMEKDALTTFSIAVNAVTDGSHQHDTVIFFLNLIRLPTCSNIVPVQKTSKNKPQVLYSKFHKI